MRAAAIDLRETPLTRTVDVGDVDRHLGPALDRTAIEDDRCAIRRDSRLLGCHAIHAGEEGRHLLRRQVVVGDLERGRRTSRGVGIEAVDDGAAVATPVRIVELIAGLVTGDELLRIRTRHVDDPQLFRSRRRCLDEDQLIPRRRPVRMPLVPGHVGDQLVEPCAIRTDQEDPVVATVGKPLERDPRLTCGDRRRRRWDGRWLCRGSLRRRWGPRIRGRRSRRRDRTPGARRDREDTDDERRPAPRWDGRHGLLPHALAERCHARVVRRRARRGRRRP